MGGRAPAGRLTVRVGAACRISISIRLLLIVSSFYIGLAGLYGWIVVDSVNWLANASKGSCAVQVHWDKAGGNRACPINVQ